MLKKFDNSPYLGYNIKYSHNEPTDSYFFLIRHITEIIQNKRHILLCTKFVKLGVNKTIRHFNKAIQSEEL